MSKPTNRLWEKFVEFCAEMRACWDYLLYHDRMQRQFVADTIRSAIERRRR